MAPILGRPGALAPLLLHREGQHLPPRDPLAGDPDRCGGSTPPLRRRGERVAGPRWEEAREIGRPRTATRRSPPSSSSTRPTTSGSTRHCSRPRTTTPSTTPRSSVKLYDEILANQFGNLAQRLLVLAEGSARRDRPDAARSHGGGDRGLDRRSERRIRDAHERITVEFESVHLKEALEIALTEIREENRRFHEAKPWEASPMGTAGRRSTKASGSCTPSRSGSPRSCRSSTAELRGMLGGTSPASAGGLGLGPRSARTRPTPRGNPTALPSFGREDRTEGRVFAKGRGPPRRLHRSPAENPGPALDVRAARIREVGDPSFRGPVIRPHRRHRGRESANGGRRPASLLHGRTSSVDVMVALLSNLEPRRIRSVESQGMVLAASRKVKSVCRAPLVGAPGTPILGATTPVPRRSPTTRSPSRSAGRPGHGGGGRGSREGRCRRTIRRGQGRRRNGDDRGGADARGAIGRGNGAFLRSLAAPLGFPRAPSQVRRSGDPSLCVSTSTSIASGRRIPP